MTATALERVLSARIRAARRSVEINGKPMSQQALADRLQVHVVTVSGWERAKSTPTVENLAAIADATGRPLAYFMGEGEDDEEDERALRAIAIDLIAREQLDPASDLLNRVRVMKARRETRNELAERQREETPA